jgi:membrane-associated phospholipid phosphatase
MAARGRPILKHHFHAHDDHAFAWSFLMCRRSSLAKLGAVCLSILVVPACQVARAEPSLNGQSGLIAMPDARIDPDQLWRIGFSVADPYTTLWSSVSILPWLEISGRVNKISGVPGFDPPFEDSYGDYKDKTFDAKIRLLDESRWGPSVAVGLQDYLGTGIFRANYVALGKRVGDFDLTLGVGEQRIDGVFGGVRYAPAWASGFAAVAEYDAYDYSHDIGAAVTGVDQREKGWNIGLEYQHRLYGLSVARLHDTWALNAHLNIPLSEKDLVPKTEEPEPYLEVPPRPTLEQWRASPGPRRHMFGVLHAQGFKSPELRLEGLTLDARLTNARISRMSRAVGRAARILLALGPVELREIRITYLAPSTDMAVATYIFFDLDKLSRYFSGMISRRELAHYVAIEYAAPQTETRADLPEDDIDAVVNTSLDYGGSGGGDFVSFVREDSSQNQFRITPKAEFFFNNKSGPFRYDLYLRGSLDRRLAQGLYLKAALDLTLAEDLSEVRFEWPGQLPTVRTDLDDYNRGQPLKLSRLLVNRFQHPARHVYTRASAGIYEEMYAGVGGQALYAPAGGRWAADVSMDWVIKRDYEGWFGFQDYSTVTAIGSLHYRMPYGLTLTTRVGRFLAQDLGVRVEAKRRFVSGVEMGAWYTVTNKDEPNYNDPSSTEIYHDKGIFISLPLSTLLPRDSRNTTSIALSSWTVDSGQMVVSPGDLYSLLEKPYMSDMHDADGLREFGDVNDDYHLPRLGDGASDWENLGGFVHGGAQAAAGGLSLRTVGAGIGLTLLASALDDSADQFAQEHGDQALIKGLRRVGDALPYVGLLGSGALALIEGEGRLKRTAYASVQAGAATLVATGALRYAIGRDRPLDGNGNDQFHPFRLDNIADSGMPSMHTGLTWAALTPYAKEYGMPWLYGVAALSNLARVSGREHWFSDTVAGSLLGYLMGSLAWEANRSLGGNAPKLWIGPESVALSWETQ